MKSNCMRDIVNSGEQVKQHEVWFDVSAAGFKGQKAATADVTAEVERGVYSRASSCHEESKLS